MIRVLIDGEGEGEVLRLTAPISFWGGVDAATSEIVLAGHPERGMRVAGAVLVIPRLAGSSSSSAVMLELCRAGLAPAALILGAADAILPVGVLAARQMGWAAPPVLAQADLPYETGERVTVRPGGVVERG